LLSNIVFKKTYCTNGYKKIIRLKDEFGLGMCTSCGYNFVNYENDCHTLDCNFILLYFFTPITEKSMTTFLGWTFPHCTAVPILYENGCIRLSNKNKQKHPVFVTAWGNSGGMKHF
jgi:hypothetical protein